MFSSASFDILVVRLPSESEEDWTGCLEMGPEERPMSPEVILASCQIANAHADGGDKTKAIAVPVPASSG